MSASDMTVPRLFASSLLLALTGCSDAPGLLGLGECRIDRARIAGNPIEAADAAFSRGDDRFLAACGYNCFPQGVQRDAALKHGFIRLPNTSDRPVDASCTRYNQEARRYAARYNQRILDRAAALERRTRG